MERPPADPLHRIGGHPPLARAAGLLEALHDLDPEDRIACFTGATSTDRREELKRRFNADPGNRSAAHPDLHRCGARRHQSPVALPRPGPLRPALESGPAGAAQRPHRPQAPAVARRSGAATSSMRSARRTRARSAGRKTETIRRQLGSVGPGHRRIASTIGSPARALRAARQARTSLTRREQDPRIAKAREEMDDATERRIAREARELDACASCWRTPEARRRRNRGSASGRRRRACAGPARSLDAARAGEVGRHGAVPVRSRPCRLSPRRLAGGARRSRVRRRGPARERLKDWRAAAPLRAIAFEPARDPKTAPTPQTSCRSISNTGWSDGCCRGSSARVSQPDSSRACVVIGPGAQPRVVLLGRLALYGAGAARLHEEIFMVTARLDRAGPPHRAAATVRRAAARKRPSTSSNRRCATAHAAASAIVERLRASAARDAADLEPELRRRAAARRAEDARDRARRARASRRRRPCAKLLADQRERIARREAKPR